ncbi:MAG TPA: MBL fold metallo-hydrolase [Dermatophilaceae bacterium]|nr:MBL fold metallo-hydrolase [Dermatophilaceae bacterium]
MADRPMTLTFLGAAGTVTGSKYLLTVGERRVLVDGGMFQGDKRWREVNWASFPVEPTSLSDILVTHAHIDHVGYLPALVAAGFAGPIWCTESTKRLAEIVLLDAAHLQERETERAIEGGYSKHLDPKPLYTVADAEATIPLLRVIPFDSDVDLGQGLSARWTRAGHILGSASITVTARRAGQTESVLFSGDLGRHDHPVLRPREIPPSAPVALIESTYGDREHPEPAGLPHEAMADAIRRTVERGGSVLIPAFAVDRTEVILVALQDMLQAGRIPNVPIYLNSPMAVAGLAVYREAYAKGELRRDLDPDDLMHIPGLKEVADAEQSKALNRPARSCIIISSSGMATGGRVVHHLEAMLPDPRHTVVFTGFQGPGTRGRMLLDGEQQMKFRGRYVMVRAEIVQDTEFSVHADASDLLDWLRELSPRPQTVFCVHGEDRSRAALAERIRAELGIAAVCPSYGEVVTIGADGQWGEAGQVAVGPAVGDGVAGDDGGAGEGGGSSMPPAPGSPPAPRQPSPLAPAAPPEPEADPMHDRLEQVQVILETALGQVQFAPETARPAMTETLQAALRLAEAGAYSPAALRRAVDDAMTAAVAAVQTPGGQSVVALLASIPRIIG